MEEFFKACIENDREQVKEWLLAHPGSEFTEKLNAKVFSKNGNGYVAQYPSNELSISLCSPLTYLITRSDAKNFSGVIKLLVQDPRIDINQQQSTFLGTPLYNAVIAKRFEFVAMLLKEKRIDPNIPDFNKVTPLYAAIRTQQPEIVRLLVQDARVNVNQGDYKRNAPLRVAVYQNDIESIERLLKREDLNPNLQDALKLTPLMIAVQKRYPAAVALLLQDKRVDVNKRDKLGAEVIHHAVEKVENEQEKENQQIILTMLLDHKNIDPNKTYFANKMTVLHLAVMQGDPEIVYILTHHSTNSVNLDIVSPNMKKPSVLARELLSKKEKSGDAAKILNYTEIANMLESREKFLKQYPLLAPSSKKNAPQ